MKPFVQWLVSIALATPAPALAQPERGTRDDAVSSTHPATTARPPIDGFNNVVDDTDDPEMKPFDDPSLPAGSILVSARGLSPDQLAQVEVSLVSWQQGQRDSSRRVRAKTFLNASGSAYFVGVGSDNASDSTRYGVAVEYEGVSYASPSFRLTPLLGKQVPFRVFSLTSSLDEAMVNVQVAIYVEPRDQHLYVEQLFQFTNASERIWRGDSIAVGLASNVTGFMEAHPSSALSLERVSDEVMIKGLIAPGTTDVAFHYQLPYSGSTDLYFTIKLPPRVSAIEASAAVRTGIGFSISGFPAASVEHSEQGQRLLVLRRVIPPGGALVEELALQLSGLPTNHWSKTLAVCSTLIMMFVSVVAAVVGRRRMKVKMDDPHDALVVRLVKELRMLEVEEKLAAGTMTTEDYEVVRGELVDRVVDALVQSDGLSKG